MKKYLVVLIAFSLAALGQAQTSVGPSKGSLVIVGGGRVGPEIRDKFISLAGGPDANFVLVPTASDDEALNRQRQQESGSALFGLKNVTVLHTRDRKEADSEAFVAPLRKATGVWISGGRQWRLVDSYLNTATLKELWAVLDRGGVIGGTSAGASIMASYMVRGAREGNTIMMAKGYEVGFGFLKNSAIDQHLNTRKREDDLKQVITARPELLGIGLDESTAIVVQGDQFEVIGAGRVAINDGKDHDGKPYYFLKAGDRFDLKTRTRLTVNGRQ